MVKSLCASGSLDFTRDRSVSGRIVKISSDVNGYLIFRQSGYRGLECFVILGDPNAFRFRESVLIKVGYPLEIILHRTTGPKAH